MKNSVAFSPQANYTYWSIFAGLRILVPTFVDKGVSRGKRGGTPMAVNLFSRPDRLLFLPCSSSFILTRPSGPSSRPTTTEKTWWRRELWPLVHRRGQFIIIIIIKNGVFWDVTPWGSCKNRCLGGTWRLLHQGDKNRWTRNNASCN
jgi:hypothetical protein